MSKLSIELAVKSEATPDKPILQANISLETLHNLKIAQGEEAVKNAIWSVFNRMMNDLKTPPRS